MLISGVTSFVTSQTNRDSCPSPYFQAAITLQTTCSYYWHLHSNMSPKLFNSKRKIACRNLIGSIVYHCNFGYSLDYVTRRHAMLCFRWHSERPCLHRKTRGVPNAAPNLVDKPVQKKGNNSNLYILIYTLVWVRVHTMKSSLKRWPSLQTWVLQ